AKLGMEVSFEIVAIERELFEQIATRAARHIRRAIVRNSPISQVLDGPGEGFGIILGDGDDDVAVNLEFVAQGEHLESAIGFGVAAPFVVLINRVQPHGYSYFAVGSFFDFLQFGPIERLAVAANLTLITKLHGEPEKVHCISSQQELATAPSDN